MLYPNHKKWRIYNENKPLEVSSSLVNEKVKFECKTPGRESIFVDYTPPAGDGEGFTSLELLLASISTCIGTTARVLIENRLGKKISKLDFMPGRKKG